MDYKVLQNIEPYNDIWYKSCFYHAFFPVINHFDKSILPFILNDFFVYMLNTNNNYQSLTLDCLGIRNEEDILKSIGIHVQCIKSSADIARDLISAIDCESPVNIHIDSYYESIRSDVYKKVHCPHVLLIFGYNKLEKYFHAVEHRYRESVLFEKRTISYSDIVDSYNGYIKNYHKATRHPTFMKYSLNICRHDKKKLSCTFDIWIRDYINNILRKELEITQGLNNIKYYSESIKNIFFDISALNLNVDNLLDNLNKIVNYKNAQRYTLLKAFKPEPEIILLLESIISCWSFVRGIIGKYKFSGIYDVKSFSLSIEKIIRIYSLEQEYYDKLFSFYKKQGSDIYA